MREHARLKVGVRVRGRGRGRVTGRIRVRVRVRVRARARTRVSRLVLDPALRHRIITGGPSQQGQPLCLVDRLGIREHLVRVRVRVRVRVGVRVSP